MQNNIERSNHNATDNAVNVEGFAHKMVWMETQPADGKGPVMSPRKCLIGRLRIGEPFTYQTDVTTVDTGRILSIKSGEEGALIVETESTLFTFRKI